MQAGVQAPVDRPGCRPPSRERGSAQYPCTSGAENRAAEEIYVVSKITGKAKQVKDQAKKKADEVSGDEKLSPDPPS